jgi:integrase
MKLGEWLDEWYQNFCLGILKPYTCVSYETIIRLHLKPALGAVRLSDLNAGQVQKMVQGLHKQNLSAKTIKNVHGCLSAALEQAKADGKIASNPCEFVKLPKLVQKEINALSVPQMSALLDAAAGDEYEQVIYVCLFCGLRKGEALGLSWKQVDFEKNRITISQQLQRLTLKNGGYSIVSGTKNGKCRYIDAPAFVMDVFKDVQRQQLLNRIKAGKAWCNEWDLVFTNDLGEHLQMVTMHKHFKKIAAAAGVPDARIHDLRHSFATLSLANGDDVKTVQDNLGHATAAFTLQKYIHASEQMKQESANRMQTFFDQNLKKA